ncbi:MAG TPA: PLP-dependent aminotransferase family protein [Pyrinomonadaceae bacterium]|nr:PLP-dependent aminotransferase family protein [Pyrinomonadaceae bacterium]
MPVATLNMIRLDRRLRASLQSQLYRQLRELIISGKLQTGIRLPSTRDLVGQLDVSRNTIVYALDRLIGEGYLNSRIGSGIYVADLQQPTPGNRTQSAPRSVPEQVQTSRRTVATANASISPTYSTSRVRPFRPCQPAVDHFPLRTWNRARSYALRSQSNDMLREGDAAGLLRLRRALAVYLQDARGVRCDAEQIVITAGAQQALSLVATSLTDPHDRVWIEDPGYLGARAAFLAARVNLIPIRIDNEGICIPSTRKSPRVIYCTPSRQFPLGTTMTLARRLALLEFARKNDCWIVEDDYDSEFRYVERPLPALQGLTGHDRVLYAGSFSKVLFPSLRLGYLVVPEGLVEVFRKAKEIGDAGCATIDQATAAIFVEEGFFSTHVRRMRKLYRERRDVFLETSSRLLSGWIKFPDIDAGMDATGWLQSNASDARISRELAASGVDVPPVSAYSLKTSPPGLVFGFTAFSPAQLRAALKAVATTMKL